MTMPYMKVNYYIIVYICLCMYYKIHIRMPSPIMIYTFIHISIVVLSICYD